MERSTTSLDDKRVTFPKGGYEEDEFGEEGESDFPWRSHSAHSVLDNDDDGHENEEEDHEDHEHHPEDHEDPHEHHHSHDHEHPHDHHHHHHEHHEHHHHLQSGTTGSHIRIRRSQRKTGEDGMIEDVKEEEEEPDFCAGQKNAAKGDIQMMSIHKMLVQNEGGCGFRPHQSEHQVKKEETKIFEPVDSLAPFKLRWVYGRTSHSNVINLTGLYENHIAYASSNNVVIYDFVKNEQQCLQGHKNAITALVMDKNKSCLATVDAGPKSLVIIWDIFTGKPIKYFQEPHNGTGCVTAAFTGEDNILATMGNEEPGKQTVSLWDCNPSQPLKSPLVTGLLTGKSDKLKELSFDYENNPTYFAATGDRSIVFGTWVKPDKNSREKDNENGEEGSIFCYKPKTKKNQMMKYKKFCHSLWLRKGEWLATSTMAGFIVIWGPPMVLGLEEPPDPNKNIRELKRFFRLSDEGLTYFTVHEDYVIVGDARGLIRFFDKDMKLLRWTNNFFLKSVHCISFNINDELPQFKKELRDKFDKNSGDYIKKVDQSRVRDYSMGGTKDRELSMTTIERPPMPCTDFVFSVAGGDIFYYHFKQSKVDLLVHGTPGKFVTCDVCPGSNNIIFATRKGDIHVYDYETHKLIFADQIFVSNHRVNTMKFHPTGYFVTFGLVDGHLTFRRNFSWKTLISPMNLTTSPILKIIFSEDGLFLSCFTHNRLVFLVRYLPKAKNWVSMGKCKMHNQDICDIQFLHDPQSRKNRLFSLGLDRYLVEYDVQNCNARDPKGLRVLKVMRLEETCQPTSMVFDGPPEFGWDCITFSNTLNKLRLFNYKEEKVMTTVAGPSFDSNHPICRLIEYPVQMNSKRMKKFIIFIRENKLGIIDPPMDGNPHRYMAVYTHPEPIVGIALVPDKHQVFTVGHDDNCAYQWEANVCAVEAAVIMGGMGVTPFYQSLRRQFEGTSKDIINDLELIVFFINLKRTDSQVDVFNITQTIRISEIPAVCRACGFFPSEYEVGLMIDEARRLKMKHGHYHDDHTTDFAFEDFVKLFCNYCYKISNEEVEEAFATLGFEEKSDSINICESNLIRLLTTEGEKLNPCDLPVYLESLYMDGPFSNLHLDCKMGASDPTLFKEVAHLAEGIKVEKMDTWVQDKSQSAPLPRSLSESTDEGQKSSGMIEEEPEPDELFVGGDSGSSSSSDHAPEEEQSAADTLGGGSGSGESSEELDMGGLGGADETFVSDDLYEYDVEKKGSERDFQILHRHIK